MTPLLSFDRESQRKEELKDYPVSLDPRRPVYTGFAFSQSRVTLILFSAYYQWSDAYLSSHCPIIHKYM